MGKIFDFDDLPVDGDEGADWEHSSENPANYPPKPEVDVMKATEKFQVEEVQEDDQTRTSMVTNLGQTLIQGLEEILSYERTGEPALRTTYVESPDPSAILGIKLPAEVAIAIDVINALDCQVMNSVETIAEQIDVEARSIYPVVNELKNAGIVKTVKGPKGGTYLLRFDVTVADLYSIFYKTQGIPEGIGEARPSQQLAQHLYSFFQQLRVKL
jgi:hypothetical protein